MSTQTTLSALRRRLEDPRLQVLCGAGISMVAPSSLSSGNQLRDLRVDRLLRDEYNERILDEVFGSKSYQALLPEADLQDVGLFASEHLDRLMSWVLFRARRNVVHHAIADRFDCVFTTNVDKCLEIAGTQDVVHLHGTIADPGALQNRVIRLGKGRDPDVESFCAKLNCNPLLVLGYSLRDDDVVENIERGEPSEILYLSYEGSVPPYLTKHNIARDHSQGNGRKAVGRQFGLEDVAFDMGFRDTTAANWCPRFSCLVPLLPRRPVPQVSPNIR